MAYRYKVKYFCGGNTVSMSSNKDIAAGIEYFDERLLAGGSIQGESGIKGLKIDFNAGLRLQVPAGNFHVCIKDGNSGLTFLDEDISERVLISLEKYFVPWHVEVQQDGQYVFVHDCNPEGQKVYFSFQVPALGDILALLPYAEAFGERYRCDMTCTVPGYLSDVVHACYPKMRVVQEIEDCTYATYYLNAYCGYYMGQAENVRSWPLVEAGKSILGVDCKNHHGFSPQGRRIIDEPYVCIAVQASLNWKAWLNETGWDEVVEYLQTIGYRVLCIDKEVQTSNNGITVCKPEQAENFTGDLPLAGRLELLAHAEFFIGVSSGLAWLAREAGCPVVLISGITYPWNEFYTPYRIYNKMVCHGCYHDKDFSLEEVGACPRHGGTGRAYECSRSITGQQVINVIDELRCDKRLL